MRNRTIQLLHQGKRRKIQKQEYSKLRPYNKIKTSRLRQSSVRDTELQSLCQQVNQQDVLSLIQQLNIANAQLLQQNKNIMRELNKEDKIIGIMMKKIPLHNAQPISQEQDMFYLKYEENINKILQLKSNKSYFKNLELVTQLKLSFQVIQLEQKLEDKKIEHKKLLKNEKIKNYQEYIKNLNQNKTIFIKYVFQSLGSNYSPQNTTNPIFSKIQEMKNSKNQLSQLHTNIWAKIKQKKKYTNDLQKNLQSLSFQLTNLQRLFQGYKNNSGQNSSQYIEVQNGQMKNQQDIKKQLKQIEDKIANEEKELHQFMEGKMLQKIHLIQEIQKYEFQCKRLGKTRLSFPSHSLIKIV